MAADQAVLDGEIADGEFKPRGGLRQQEQPRLRRRLAQRHRRDLDSFAGDGRALIGNARGVAEHDDDASKGHVKFLCDDLSERRPNAGAEIDMAVIGGNCTVGRDLDEGLMASRRGGTHDGQGA